MDSWTLWWVNVLGSNPETTVCLANIKVAKHPFYIQTSCDNSNFSTFYYAFY